MKIINNTDKSLTNEIIGIELKCTKASIYYENNQPFINWYGEARTLNGYVLECHIPKMSLDISKIEQECAYVYLDQGYSNYYSNILKSRQVFVKDGFKADEDIIITIKEREMTKEQIEKELGYKVKIKE